MVKYMIYQTDTPVGTIYIASYNDKLLCIDTDYRGFINSIGQYGKAEENDCKVLDETINQLKLYFSRKLKSFDLPMHIEGTPFRRAVWSELMKIPYGATVSYADIARAIDNPRAVRAVGGAVGSNPLPFVIPCHRVIGKNGDLVGFGLGLDVKKFLLELESAG